MRGVGAGASAARPCHAAAALGAGQVRGLPRERRGGGGGSEVGETRERSGSEGGWKQGRVCVVRALLACVLYLVLHAHEEDRTHARVQIAPCHQLSEEGRGGVRSGRMGTGSYDRTERQGRGRGGGGRVGGRHLGVYEGVDDDEDGVDAVVVADRQARGRGQVHLHVSGDPGPGTGRKEGGGRDVVTRGACVFMHAVWCVPVRPRR